LGADAILHEKRGDAGDAGGQRRGQRRVRQVQGDQRVERGDELMDALGRQIEREQFDGDEAFALRIVRAKYGTKSPGTDLMKNTKRSERVWRRSAGSFRVQ